MSLKRRRALLFAILATTAAGCLAGDDDPSPMGPLPPFEVRVDPALVPPMASLPGLDGGAERPIAAITAASGHVGMFVESELLVVTDDRAALDALVARYGGEVLTSVEPGAMAGMPGVHLIRIDPSRAEPGGLAGDLRALEPEMTQELRVSSDRGLATLAAAAREATSGATLGLNWVSEGAGFIDRTTADFNGPEGENAFTWSYMSRSGDMRTGTADAWRALALADRLDNQIRIGILDGGFVSGHPDYPAGASFPVASHMNVANSMTCGMNRCNWHGTGCALTATGVPDNGYGAAGSGGPVAVPIMVQIPGDLFSVIDGLVRLGNAGADIVSMSFGVQIPGAFGFSMGPLNIATEVARSSGALLFASAGNSRTDVDEQDCFIGCWEDTVWAPCEATGVICVGATNMADRDHADYTNWGTGSGADTVDLFAPGCEYVSRLPGSTATTPGSPTNAVDQFCGTSAATPFLAGVAALVWAADPSQSDDQVESRLRLEANESTDPKVRPVVDAYNSVLLALGGAPNEPPLVEIIYPTDTDVPLGEVNVIAEITDDQGPYEITWTSDVDGTLLVGSTATLVHDFLTPGLRHITVTVTDPEGLTGEAGIDLNVVNSAPQVEITSAVTMAYRGIPVHLRGSAIDDDEGELPCSSLQWSEFGAADILSSEAGCEIDVTFGLPNGTHIIQLRATDEHGATDITSTVVMVVDPPADPPPTGRILTPADGMHYLSDDSGIMLTSEVMDSEPVTLRWRAVWARTSAEIGTLPSFLWRASDAGIDCSVVERPITIQLLANDGTAEYMLDSITVTLDCYPG